MGNSPKKKTWLKRKKSIAFIGEFSAGKTSIVNRFLQDESGEGVELPVSAKATTAIPTYVSGGDEWVYRFVSPDNKLKVVSKDIFSSASKEVLAEANGIHSLLKYFVLSIPSAALRNVSILDTPGFSSNDSEDALRTMDVINECDALFWVVDVNRGELNKSSLKIIKENLKKDLYVIVNKADTKESREVAAVIEKIKRTAKEAGLSVENYIPFSSKEKTDVLLKIIGQVKNSNDDLYVDDLKEELNRKMADFLVEKKHMDNQFIYFSQQVDEWTATVETGLSQLKFLCKKAGGIPHLETHFFTSDKFEMSVDEFREMSNALQYAQESAEKVIEDNSRQDQAIEQKTSAEIQRGKIKPLCRQMKTLIGKYCDLLARLNDSELAAARQGTGQGDLG